MCLTLFWGRSGKMIRERKIVSGKPATVIYLHADLSPADSKAVADVIKVLFDTGKVWVGPMRKNGGAGGMKNSVSVSA